MLKLKNGHVVDPANGIDNVTDILIDNGKIVAVGSDIQSECDEIDLSGKFVFPGIVDLHVHLRDFEQSAKEDIITGSNAAAAGGVTSLIAMPNTVPAVDSIEMLNEVYKKAADAKVHVYQAAAISKGLMGAEPTDLKQLADAGAAAFSDDGRPVLDTRILYDALKTAKELSLPILAHCEDLYLAKSGIINDGEVANKLGVTGIPAAAEDAGTAREIALAAASGCPVHICHVSTANSVAMIRDAKRRGVFVTAETAPHYFTLDETDVLSKNADFRMNPPLRTETDKQAILDALVDSTIDCIATDHAPHTDSEKADFLKAPNGSIGMETSLSVSYDALVRSGKISVSKLIELMSSVPAKIAGLPAGSLSVGENADIAVFDPDYTWTVDRDKLHGKSHNTPFHGKTLQGKVVLTLVNGKIVYED